MILILVREYMVCLSIPSDGLVPKFQLLIIDPTILKQLSCYSSPLPTRISLITADFNLLRRYSSSIEDHEGYLDTHLAYTMNCGDQKIDKSVYYPSQTTLGPLEGWKAFWPGRYSNLCNTSFKRGK